MFGFKVVFALVLVVACTGFCIYYDSVVQPTMTVSQIHDQLAVRTDGTGDKLATERRALTQVYHWPTYAACGFTFVVVLLMFLPNVARAAERGVKEVNKTLDMD